MFDRVNTIYPVESQPPLSPQAFNAAQALGYFRKGDQSAGKALVKLQQMWAKDGQTPDSFADFEAALVREGLRLRRAAPLRYRVLKMEAS